MMMNPAFYNVYMQQLLSKTSYKQSLVRLGGLEPPQLALPPPQDGVSTNSTTIAFFTAFTMPLNLLRVYISNSKAGLRKTEKAL